METKTTEIEVMIHRWTNDAVLVSLDGLSRNAKWLPRTAVEFEHELRRGSAQIITVEEDLATKKGLV